MRTKTMLLGAALFAAGALSSMAQSSVYSLNVVGYVTVTVPAYPGFAMLANPLDDGQGDYLTNIIAGDPPNYDTIPDGTTIYPWSTSGGTYGSQQTFFAGPGGGWGSSLQLPPGNGFWIRSGDADGTGPAFTITFVGNVMQGTLSSSLGTGFTIAGSQIPAALPVGYSVGSGLSPVASPGPNDTNNPTLQIPAFDGDQIFLYTNTATASGYSPDSPTFFNGSGWSDTQYGPVINPAQGFWYARGGEDEDANGNYPVSSTQNGVQNWTYTFTVQ